MVYAELMEALEPGDTTGGEALLELAKETDAPLVGAFAASLAYTTGEIELGLLLMDSLEAWGDTLAWAPAMRFMLLAGTGRPDSARDWLSRVPDEQSRILFGAMAEMTPFLPTDLQRVEALRDSLLALDMDAAPVQAFSRTYMTALLDLRLGRLDPAMAAADSLLAAADTLSPALGESVALWGRSIRATAALDNADPEVALEALGAVDGPILVNMATSPLLDRTRERYLLGSLLVEAGRVDEAVPWLEHGIGGATSGLLYLPMSHLRLGEAHERAGRTAEASRAYSRFLRYFAHAEPAMQPYVRQGRAALQRITREASETGTSR